MSEKLQTTVKEIEPVVPKIIAKIYSCPVCSSSFPKRKDLIAHMKERHPDFDLKEIKKIIPVERESREKLILEKPKRGLYLVPPHGKLIAEEDKTIIVKSKKFHVDNEALYLLEDKVCWGVIKLEAPKEVNYDLFDRERDKHKVTDDEAFRKWGWKEDRPLYFYKVNPVALFESPKPVKLPRGVQVFVDAENIQFLSLSSLTPTELEYFHAYSHGRKINSLHRELLKVFDKLHIPHVAVDQLDRESELLIADWKTYSPMKLIETERGKRVVADDHRIVHAWWKLLKAGKALKSEQFKDISLTRQREIVKELHDKIVRAFDKLNWKHDTPMSLQDDFDPNEIERKDLEKIDDVFVKKLGDDKLRALDERLHELYSEMGKVTEPLENAHIFVWKEIRKRGILHDIEDGLTKATALEVVEYPTPRGEASSEGVITLKDVLKAMPDRIVLHDPPQHVHLVGRIINEGHVPKDHDIDILFKQSFPDVRVIHEFLKNVRQKNPEIAERLHFVFDPWGPQIGFSVPVYRIGYTKMPENELIKHHPFEYLAAAIKLGTPFRALKAQAGFNKFEFFEVQDLWENWVAERISKGIIIQKKYDGMRFQVHKIGKQIKIITEDRQRDRASIFNKSVAEMLSKFKVTNVILDTEMVEYDCKGKKIKDKEEICEALPREEMIPWVTVTKKALDDENIVFHVHDCLWVDDSGPLNEKPYSERMKAYEKAVPKGLEHWRTVPSFTANDKRSFERVLNKIRNWKGSEGAMLKLSSSDYKLTGRTSEWAKIKNVKEIDVMVWEVVPKKTAEGKIISGQYMYIAAFAIPSRMKNEVRQRDLIEYQGKFYVKIGKTYGTSVRAKRGDIITVKPIRIAEFETKDQKKYWTWMFPWFSMKHPAKKEPDTVDTVRKLVKAGTAPLSADIITLKLNSCPYWRDNQVCPLKDRFAGPTDNLSAIVRREFLKFPVACPFAFRFRCRYIKPYYYGEKVDKVLGEDISDEDYIELGRLFGSPVMDDHVLDAIQIWERDKFSTEKLKNMQSKGYYKDVLTEQNEYFEMFVLNTASMGIKLPHIPLNKNWYMDQAAQMIVESHLNFYPKLNEKNPYEGLKIEKMPPDPKTIVEEE